jgi:hypothetical protein
MTNDQFSTIMIEFERLHARLDKIEIKGDKPVYFSSPNLVVTTSPVKAPRYPNEGIVEYLKRIGEYNEASGVDKLN